MYFLDLLLICVSLLQMGYTDKPCAPRAVSGQSVVCVCNSTYCDELTLEKPPLGTYVSYTSSKAGSRFLKRKGKLHKRTSQRKCCQVMLDVNSEQTYQSVEGFGAAVTDAAAINWLSINQETRQHIVNSYFGEGGLQYNMIRVPVGGSDFSTRPYSYNELPKNDRSLSNFTLTKEDYDYKIPMIKSCFEASRTPVHVVASVWSPPPWMKTNAGYIGASRLKPDCYQAYADYYYKFIEKYSEQGIPVWAITTTNEPLNGVMPYFTMFNSLGWMPDDMGNWITNNLGPKIRNSTFKNVKILALDDQRYTIPYWFNQMIKKWPQVLQYIDGVAVHYYGDWIAPPSMLQLVSASHPDKFLLATEACEGSFPWDKEKVLIGSWQRAKNYITDIITDLNHDVVGWIDWNMCLDPTGGPNWAKNFVDSAIIVYSDRGEFIKQPMFYAIGHVAKFVPRGSKRIHVDITKPVFWASVDHVAFLTPANTIVMIIYNDGNAKDIGIRLGNDETKIELEANSITTIKMLQDNT